MPLNMLKIAKGSRKEPCAGDIFVFQMRQDGLYRYGRVISANVILLDATGAPSSLTAHLVYIFKSSSPTKLPTPLLSKDDLIVPPQLLSDAGWRDGYFETVEHRVLRLADELPIHCFYDPAKPKRPYVDADGKPLPRRHEPCGFYALGGYGSVDLKVSKALGFPEPTEDPPDTLAESATPRTGRKKRKRRDVDHAVILSLADAPAGPLMVDFERLEEQLSEAVTRAGVGRCDGHEFGLGADSAARIYFHGKDADRLAEAILPVARQAGLSQGSHLLKQYGEPGDAEERVEL